jgi:hypothetical protein
MTDVTIHDRKPPIVVLRERLPSAVTSPQRADRHRPRSFHPRLGDLGPGQSRAAGLCFQSLWLACMRACRDNLLPDGREGAIVPYKSNAQWIPMYQGLLKRFRQSGQCKWITANVVRQGEVFEHWIDENGEHFRHVPGISDGVAPSSKSYAAALTKDGAFYVAVMTLAEINKVKAMSKASREDSPLAAMAGRNDEEDCLAPPQQIVARRPRHL